MPPGPLGVMPLTAVTMTATRTVPKGSRLEPGVQVYRRGQCGARTGARGVTPNVSPPCDAPHRRPRPLLPRGRPRARPPATSQGPGAGPAYPRAVASVPRHATQGHLSLLFPRVSPQRPWRTTAPPRAAPCGPARQAVSCPSVSTCGQSPAVDPIGPATPQPGGTPPAPMGCLGGNENSEWPPRLASNPGLCHRGATRDPELQQ